LTAAIAAGRAAPPAPPATELQRELRLRDVVLFNVSAVAGVRSLVFMARAGGGIVTLCMLAAAAFFLPSAFAIIRLARKYPEQGGMYVWAKEQFGQAHGFLCAWFYFLSSVIVNPRVTLPRAAWISAAVCTVAGAADLGIDRRRAGILPGRQIRAFHSPSEPAAAGRRDCPRCTRVGARPTSRSCCRRWCPRRFCCWRRPEKASKPATSSWWM
jgi:hypothetical protein